MKKFRLPDELEVVYPPIKREKPSAREQAMAAACKVEEPEYEFVPLSPTIEKQLPKTQEFVSKWIDEATRQKYLLGNREHDDQNKV